MEDQILGVGLNIQTTTFLVLAPGLLLMGCLRPLRCSRTRRHHLPHRINKDNRPSKVGLLLALKDVKTQARPHPEMEHNPDCAEDNKVFRMIPASPKQTIPHSTARTWGP